MPSASRSKPNQDYKKAQNSMVGYAQAETGEKNIPIV